VVVGSQGWHLAHTNLCNLHQMFSSGTIVGEMVNPGLIAGWPR